MSRALRRAWLLANVVVTLALLPALFPDAVGPGATEVATVGDAAVAVEVTTTTGAPPTTTTTVVAPPPTATSAPAAKAAPRTTTTTEAPPRTTSTTVVAAAPAPEPAPPPSSGSESGRATWYDYEPGICAHKTLPFGTVVTVNAVNGKSVQCTVGDRGPFVDGYVIDLHWREFEQLAPRSAGRIDVTITW